MRGSCLRTSTPQRRSVAIAARAASAAATGEEAEVWRAAPSTRARSVFLLLNAMLDGFGERVVLFRRGNLIVVSFGLFAAAAAGVALSWSGAVLIGQGLPPQIYLLLAVTGSFAVVVGSWMAGVLLDLPLVLRGGWTASRRPMFVSWGGLLTFPVTLGAFAAFSGFDLALLFDAMARAFPLAHALGRLGCLSYGCCFGRPTRGPIGIAYRNPDSKAVRVAGAAGVRLHPVPLYEAALDLAILFVVHVAIALDVPPGVPTITALLLYGVGRFWIEFLRDNDGRMAFAGFSINHLVCVLLIALCACVLPIVLLSAHPAHPVSWPAAAASASWLALGSGAGMALILLGFGVHRGKVGHW